MDERTRLLDRDPEQDKSESSRWSAFRKASIWWLCPTSFVLATVMTAIRPATVAVVKELICRQDILERTGEWLDSPSADDCSSGRLQSRVSKFFLVYQLLLAVFSTISVGFWGGFSDAYGRKSVLFVTLFGTYLAVINLTIVGTHPEMFDYRFLLFGVLIEGLAGGVIAMNSTFHAYIADVTDSTKRSLAFGFLHFAAFGGMTFGPTLGGLVIKATGNLFSVFYINIACLTLMLTYIVFILPESLDRGHRMHHAGRRKPWAAHLNIFAALFLLVKPDASVETIRFARRSVLIIATTYFLYKMSYSIAGIDDLFALYSSYKFGWDTLEQGYFFSLQSLTRAASMVTVIPFFAWAFRKAKTPGAMDVWLIRLGFFMDVAGFVMFASAESEWVFYTGAVINSVATVATVSMRAMFTTFFETSRVGAALAALSVLESIGAILCPVILNSVYSATVETEPATVFWVLSFIFFITLLLSFTITREGENGKMKVEAAEVDANIDADTDASSNVHGHGDLNDNANGHAEAAITNAASVPAAAAAGPGKDLTNAVVTSRDSV